MNDSLDFDGAQQALGDISATARADTDSDPRPGEIKAACKRGDWPTARVVFEQYRAERPRRWRPILTLAAALMDWRVVLETEQDRARRGTIELQSPHPRDLARIRFRARLELGLFNDALALARAGRSRFPAERGWRRAEAKALSGSGAHEAALGLALESWKAGDLAVVALVARALVALDSLEECANFLTAAERQASPDKPWLALARARADYWNARGQPAQGLAAMRALDGRLTSGEFHAALAKQAGLARDEPTLELLLRRAEAWTAGAPAPPARIEAAAAILSAHFGCMLDKEAVQPVLERLSGISLSARSALSLCRLLGQAGDYPRVQALARRTERLFPSSLAIRILRLEVLVLMNDPSGLGEVRTAFKRDFPAASYLRVISEANPRLWDLAELPHMLAYNLGLRDGPRQANFLNGLAEAPLTEAQIGSLREAFGASSALKRAQVEMMLAPLADLRLLETSALEPVDFSAFKESEAGTEARIGRITRELAPDGGGADLTLMRQCLRLVAGLRDRRRRAIIDTRESYAQAARLAEVIVQRIERRQPTSLLRLGDGEGHFLPAPEVIARHCARDRAAIQNIWWGAKRMEGARLGEIEARFRQAVDDSSLLGIIPPWWLMAQMASPRQLPAHRGILAGVAYGASLQRPDLILTSMHFPNDLHKWNLWPEIFAPTKSVSYVSCHDLRPFFRENFGVATRQAIHIPGEHKYAALFLRDAPAFGGDTLLDRHEAVCGALDPRPGELHIVAAGFLGKIYCDIIRERGGIGVDIGSLADYWMGFATRRYRLEQLGDIGLPNVMITDHVLAPSRDHGRIAGRKRIVHSTSDCRYNIADASEAAAAARAPSDRALLRVLGHPRCASTFMAGLLTKHGLRIGHDKMLRDGICSWTHAVSDLHVPKGDNASLGVAFNHTIAHVRDPAEATPSIVLENGSARSFNFRRLHILREIGVDLCDYREPVARAVASLVHWYDIILRLDPEAVFPVEEAETAVPAWLESIALRVEAASLAQSHARCAEAIPSHPAAVVATDVNDDDPIKTALANNPESKFGRPKPLLTPQSYAHLPLELRDKLGAYCDRFGYKRPW